MINLRPGISTNKTAAGPTNRPAWGTSALAERMGAAEVTRIGRSLDHQPSQLSKALDWICHFRFYKKGTLSSLADQSRWWLPSFCRSDLHTIFSFLLFFFSSAQSFTVYNRLDMSGNFEPDSPEWRNSSSTLASGRSYLSNG